MTKFFHKYRFFYLTLIIFFVALFIRFLYFPNNVHFSFDQARDSFTSLEILKGDFKLIGPPSFLSNKIFPGPLIFYIYAPIYLIFNKSPEAASTIFRIWNALGVFLVFYIGLILFNKRTGIIAALLFAFSYEQSQYSLFLNHQPLAVITVLLFYLGSSLFLFRQKSWGLILTTLGLGLSIQFHYGFTYLFPILIIYFVIFRKKVKIIKPKWFLFSFVIFFLTTFTFLLTELKYHFILKLISQPPTANHHLVFSVYLKETLFIINRFLHDSFIANYKFTSVLGILFLIAVIYFLLQKYSREKVTFLLIWFIFGLSLYFLSGVPSYYYSPATSVSLLIFVAFLTDKLFSDGQIIPGLLIILAIIINNLLSIVTINPYGLNSYMVIQPGMTTANQRHALDYMYGVAKGEPFAVTALTIPLNINTTWSYIFEWYGQKKYNYLPIWIGPTASGYAGNLKVINSRSNLPKKQFLVIEPTIGIREKDKADFLRVEGYFTNLKEEKKFGTIIVQLREPY